jgi:hypothetical protein
MEDYYNGELVGEMEQYLQIRRVASSPSSGVDNITLFASGNATIWYDGPFIEIEDYSKCPCTLILRQVKPGSIKGTYSFSQSDDEGTLTTFVTRYYNYSTNRTLPCSEKLIFQFDELLVEEDVIFYTARGYFEPASDIEIKDITGGFGLSVVVENLGYQTIEDIECSIFIDGRVIVGQEMNKKITIPPGGEAVLKTGFIFGFGPVSINIAVDGITRSVKARLLGPFVLEVG